MVFGGKAMIAFPAALSPLCCRSFGFLVTVLS